MATFRTASVTRYMIKSENKTASLVDRDYFDMAAFIPLMLADC